MAHRCGASPSDKLHAEVLGPGLDAINGLWMHTVADEELVLGLTGAPTPVSFYHSREKIDMKAIGPGSSI